MYQDLFGLSLKTCDHLPVLCPAPLLHADWFCGMQVIITLSQWDLLIDSDCDVTSCVSAVPEDQQCTTRACWVKQGLLGAEAGLEDCGLSDLLRLIIDHL